jgi:RNA polymerase-binding transcription factor DksA
MTCHVTRRVPPRDVRLCDECGDPISDARLAVEPTTRVCALCEAPGSARAESSPAPRYGCFAGLFGASRPS